jgi:hypothetical protein
VTLGETDRLFACSYCRVRLYFLGGEYFRYLIPPKGGSTDGLFFVPYWRFRGTHYSCPPYEVKGRVLDASFIASGHGFFPKTLGVRTQTLRLRFVSPDARGRFFRPESPLKEVIPKVEKLSGAIEHLANIKRAFHRAFIGETVSMIYSPVYVRGRGIYDAVLERPIAQLTKLREDAFEAPDARLNWKVRFLSALCPDCGWDLTGGAQSVVLLCKNCDSAWKVLRGGFGRLKVGVAPSSEDGLSHVPFWRVRARAEGIGLRTYADLVRVANLPRAVRPEWEKGELYFWLPAFRANPRLFMRLARFVTIAQPKTELDERLPKADIAPVTLGAREASDGLVTAIAAISVAKRKVFPMLSGLTIEPTRALLVFLPFRRVGNDLVEANMNFRVPRSAVSFEGK